MKFHRSMVMTILFLLAGCGMEMDERTGPQVSTKTVPGQTATAANLPVPTETATVIPTAAPIVNGIAVAAGKNHTCVVLSNGGVNCWGNNEHGQLGDGTLVNRNRPVEVKGLRDVKGIAAGWAHTCAVTHTGGVKCWGYNKNGELGNRKNEDSSVPVGVDGLDAGAVDIEAGDDHTCVVTEAGGIRCWGYNRYGQLGDGTQVSRSMPVEVKGINSVVKAAAAGWGHTCALTEGGGVKCWGNSEQGQTGNGRVVESQPAAEDVFGLTSGAAGISADGGSTCALTEGGGVECWGNNHYGQLGDGTNDDRNRPARISGMDQGAVRITVGWNHACAVTGTGELRCWGWNYYGQLGDGTKTSQLEPVRVAGSTDSVESIGVGWGHTCVVTDLGGVRCWGWNENGQLGDGTFVDSQAPLTVAGWNVSPMPSPAHATALVPTATLTATASFPIQTPVAALQAVDGAIATKEISTCALTEAGGAKCWGDNRSGQLGDGTRTDRLSPVDVIGLSSGVTAITMGDAHACALTAAGGVLCWGVNFQGQLGDGTTTDRYSPVNVSGLSSGITAVKAGKWHNCALTETGGVKCWGINHRGMLGDGTTTERHIPVDVIGLSSGVTALAAGRQHSCALMENGGIKCWGDNRTGQLGDGTWTDRHTPVDVVGSSGKFVAVVAGDYHTCALTAEGGVKCWGNNGYGQLGDGTPYDQPKPVDVSGLSSGISALALGVGHTCAVTNAGGVKCWGRNYNGQLGNGTPTEIEEGVNLPVDVLGLPGGATAVAAGWGHTCAVMKNGWIMCWGLNRYGSLGDGTRTDRLAPVDVIGFGGL